MTYLLIYTENCALSMKTFTTKKAAMKFVREFEKKYPVVPYGDDWLDCLIKGEVNEKFSGLSSWRIYE